MLIDWLIGLLRVFISQSKNVYKDHVTFFFFPKVRATNYKPCPVICDSAVEAELILAAGLVKRKISAPASEPSYLNKLETKSDTPRCTSEWISDL